MRAGYAARAGVADAVSGQLSPSNLPDHVAFTDANQTFAGSITAVSFTGSAAGLTGVPAAAVTGATLTLTGAPSASGHVVPLGYLNTALAAYLPKTGGTLTGALNGTTAGFTGSVTAGSFTGSGSGLTQLPATGLTGVVANANLPTDLARTATPTFTGRTSVDTLSVGTTGVVFSAQVHGRGSSTADDLYHLATITPSSYNNSGMVCDVCMASRWATSGCATWYVSVGRYEGDVDSPAGQGFTLQRSFTTTSTTAPLRVSWLPGATGARGMRVWIETSLTTSGYVNSKWMCRGVGDGVVPGDLHIEQAGTITELQPRP
jgi:hypothetical protein